jgi:hypothetical protein
MLLQLVYAMPCYATVGHIISCPVMPCRASSSRPAFHLGRSAQVRVSHGSFEMRNYREVEEISTGLMISSLLVLYIVTGIG